MLSHQPCRVPRFIVLGMDSIVNLALSPVKRLLVTTIVTNNIVMVPLLYHWRYFIDWVILVVPKLYSCLGLLITLIPGEYAYHLPILSKVVPKKKFSWSVPAPYLQFLYLNVFFNSFITSISRRQLRTIITTDILLFFLDIFIFMQLRAQRNVYIPWTRNFVRSCNAPAW